MKLLPFVVVFMGAATFAQAQEAPQARNYPIAGLNPSQRPVGAPVIKDVTHDKTWEARFYHGITKPYPPNLGAASDWGNWYTPFDRPGLTGGYDIREWHVQKASQNDSRQKNSGRKTQ